MALLQQSIQINSAVYLENVGWISVDSFTTDLSNWAEWFHSPSTSLLERLDPEWWMGQWWSGAEYDPQAPTRSVTQCDLSGFQENRTVFRQGWNVSMDYPQCAVRVLLFVLFYFIFIECFLKTKLDSFNSQFFGNIGNIKMTTHLFPLKFVLIVERQC